MAVLVGVILVAAAAMFLIWKYSQSQSRPTSAFLIRGSNATYNEDEIVNLENAYETQKTYKIGLALAEAYSVVICEQPDYHRIAKTIELYQQCLQEKTTPLVLYRLAWFQYLAEQFDEARETLDGLKEPGTKFPHHHLLYSRILEALGHFDEAIENYTELLKYYPGEEARVRYGLLLKRIGRAFDSRELFSQLLLDVSKKSKSYKKQEGKWVQIAREEFFFVISDELSSEELSESRK